MTSQLLSVKLTLRKISLSFNSGWSEEQEEEKLWGAEGSTCCSGFAHESTVEPGRCLLPSTPAKLLVEENLPMSF